MGHYLGNAVNIMHCWSVDRTKHKIFQNEVKISLDDWKLTYSWIKENGLILKLTTGLQYNAYILCKSKYNDSVP